MSAAPKTLDPAEKVKAGKLGASLTKAGAGIAVVFLGISLALSMGKGDHYKRFFYAYVIGWSFIFSIAVGALFMVLIHHLVRARWSTTSRRVAEIITGAFPAIFISGLGFVIPLAMGYTDLYYWGHPDAHNATLNHVLHHKFGWLDPTFFAVRFIGYGVLFSAISKYFEKKSRQQDESGDPAISETLRIVSAPAMIVYAFATSFIGFDVLMSLQPAWYSTIYSVNFWGGAMIGAFATLILVSLAIQRTGRLTRSITAEHYHDMGKWLFAWTFFWAYTAFSQFMLMWYGNMPEETVFYKYRMFSEWQWVSIAILVGHFVFPFVFLMSRWTKRIMPALVFFCVWQLVFHWVDIYWNAMPNYDWTVATREGAQLVAGPLTGSTSLHHVGFAAVDVTVWIGLIGVFLLGLGRAMTGNLIPVKDPTLSHSLAHENF
jgi:hypothetical protein